MKRVLLSIAIATCPTLGIADTHSDEPLTERCGIMIPDSKKPEFNTQYPGKTVWIDGLSVRRQIRETGTFRLTPPPGLTVSRVACKRSTRSPDFLDYKVLEAGYPLLLLGPDYIWSFGIRDDGVVGGAGDGPLCTTAENPEQCRADDHAMMLRMLDAPEWNRGKPTLRVDPLGKY